MINPYVGPVSCNVAEIALVGRIDMPRWFAFNRGTVVATCASAQSVGMIESASWRESDGAVAVLAGVGGGEVGRILTRGGGAVVARCTVP